MGDMDLQCDPTAWGRWGPGEPLGQLPWNGHLQVNTKQNRAYAGWGQRWEQLCGWLKASPICPLTCPLAASLGVGSSLWEPERDGWGDLSTLLDKTLSSCNSACLLPSSHSGLLDVPQSHQARSASVPLHLLTPLPRMLLPRKTSWLGPVPSFRFLLKCHSITEAFMAKIATSTSLLA